MKIVGAGFAGASFSAATALSQSHDSLISNLVSYNSGSQLPAIVSGIPGTMIEDLKISDVYLHQKGGADTAMAAIDPPEDEKGYPNPHRFGPLPAYGFLMRHVKNLEMSNIEAEPRTTMHARHFGYTTYR